MRVLFASHMELGPQQSETPNQLLPAITGLRKPRREDWVDSRPAWDHGETLRQKKSQGQRQGLETVVEPVYELSKALGPVTSAREKEILHCPRSCPTSKN